MLKNKRRVAGSFGLPAVLALFAALLPGGAAQADEGAANIVAPSQAAASRFSVELANAPQVVKDKAAEATRNGAKIVSIASADYTPSGSEPSAFAYPSGCGLWVLVTKVGNYAVNSSLTSCNSRPSEIAMKAQLARWRGTWWQTVASKYDETSTSQTLVVEAKHRCIGTTYTYQGATGGDLVLNGRLYTADAWDGARIVC
ncbi:hypothetical protein ABZ345_32555 [Lentzea sp. NPDC005914]|uniref:hypothetical protein n=1 Tax=Lentzea sp. NPDC005914 TaxID=3154572 RepID=UPI0034108562